MTARTDIYEAIESRVRTYSRKFPATFVSGTGSVLKSDEGRSYIDFFSAAGSVNYGHNNPALKAAIMEYLGTDGLLQSLDLNTPSKEEFLRAISTELLEPRGLDYRVQFTGPTGSNAVEAALKIARKATGRQSVVAFSGGFHGGGLGGTSVSGNLRKRRAAGVALGDVTFMPFDGSPQDSGLGVGHIARWLRDPGAGVDLPAAFILETVQGEGGLRAASSTWLQDLGQLARELGILVIVDDIQAGCGRTGSFFSFEFAHLQPDVVCLAKSIGGLGLPLAMVLVTPSCDVLEPGEHAGTFRGQNLAYVAGREALRFWSDPDFLSHLSSLADLVGLEVDSIVSDFSLEPRGRGLMRGIAFRTGDLAQRVADECYHRGVLAETSGASGQVLKLMPALNMPLDLAADGLATVRNVIEETTVYA